MNLAGRARSPPGDTLVIHFIRIRLNRDTAISGDLIVNSALNPGYVAQRKPVKDYDSDRTSDRAGGFAMLKKTTDKLKAYRVPLAPMLGCVGVAPGGGNQYRSGSLGFYGGDIDYNQLREGVTVYLPVNVPGARRLWATATRRKGSGNWPATRSKPPWRSYSPWTWCQSSDCRGRASRPPMS